MKKIVFLLMILISLSLNAQSYYDIADSKTGQQPFIEIKINGLWEVNKVTIGEEEMTPTAKWFEFLENGKMYSGNGGITNARGSFTYDQNSYLLSQISNGQKDPYGDFQVSFNDNGNLMEWTRTEDGMKVVVYLKSVQEKPLGPWDKITGNWKSENAEGIDPETKEIRSNYMLDPTKYYFGWDGRYRKYDSNGARIETGIWHIEAHSPWLWTISDADNTKTGWSIEIKEKIMSWTKEGEKEILKVYFYREKE